MRRANKFGALTAPAHALGNRQVVQRGFDDAGQQLGRSIRVLRLPPRLLAPAVLAGAAWGRLSRRPVMLSPGKLRELSWPDWVAGAEPERLPDAGRPEVTFAEGFTRTLEWYEKQGWLRPRRTAAQEARR